MTQILELINFGSKIFEGSPAQVMKDRAVLEAYLGTSEVGDNAS